MKGVVMIPVYKAFLPRESIEYAKDAIESTWISCLGKYVDLATDRLRTITGSRHVVLLNNGTSATHLVTKSLKRFYPKVKRVLVPSSCYVAVYNSLVYDSNDWEVQCVDIDPNTWNMKLEDIREGDAIYAVHNLGNIINVPALKNKYDCPIIEDNCEGFLGSHEGTQSGTSSICSAMSFFGNKNVTCGEGGAFYTNDLDIFNFVTKIKGQGQTSKRYIHDELGYNYRMTNVQAAILLGQLENLDLIRENKQRVFEMYADILVGHDRIHLQKQEENTTHSMWMFGVRFDDLGSYEDAYSYFSSHGIETRPMFYPYNVHGHLNFKGPYANADMVNRSTVIFPSYPELSNKDIEFICNRIVAFRDFIAS